MAIERVGCYDWTVESFTTPGKHYKLKVGECSCENTKAHCSLCDVCPIGVTCSCPDAVKSGIASKHVHAWALYHDEDAEIADEGADENLAPSEASTAGNDIHSDSVALEINDVDCGSIEGEQETEVVQIDAEKQLVATIQERSDSSKKELVPSFDTDGIEVEKLNICVLCDEVQPPLEEYEDEDVMEDALVLWWCCSNCKTWAHRDCMETRDCPVCDGIFEPTG
ncbi:hypothetical protein Y032_0019g3875 [Ancylostoma ceylanicum]|nr:hypothetical protein Y032_0019g3875 [Ancylostoma ceylanicum]